MYHLPLLPGYGPGSNIRSSAPPTAETTSAEIPIPRTTEMEETVEGLAYFSVPARTEELEGFVPSRSLPHETVSEVEVHTPMPPSEGTPRPPTKRLQTPDTDSFAEAVFFAYGVVVFLGLDELQEQTILEDVRGAGVMEKPLQDNRWEVEECHYEVRLSRFPYYLQLISIGQYNPYIAYPRIYNDFFSMSPERPTSE